MTVTNVSEYSARGGFDSSGHRSWQVTYRATTNSKLDGPLTVIAHESFPSYLSGYSFGSGNEGDALAFRQSITADLREEGASWRHWEVTAMFSTRPVARPDQINSSDPTSLPPEIWGSFVRNSVPVIHDRMGDPVVNPVGDAFPDMVRNESTSDLNIRNNYTASEFDLDGFTGAGDSMNKLEFFGKAQYMWLFTQFSWRQLYWGETPYYECIFGFETKINGEDWRFDPIIKGPRYLTSAGGTATKKFKDDDGLEYGTGEGYLNADGTKRAITSDPQFLRYDGAGANPPPFEVYDEVDYGATLLVPTSLPGI